MRAKTASDPMGLLCVSVFLVFCGCALDVDEEVPFERTASYVLPGRVDLRLNEGVLYGLVSGRHRAEAVRFEGAQTLIEARFPFVPEHWATDGDGLYCASRETLLLCIRDGSPMRPIELKSNALGLGFPASGLLWVAEKDYVTHYDPQTLESSGTRLWGPVDSVWTDHRAALVGLAQSGRVWTLFPEEKRAPRWLRIGEQARQLHADTDYLYVTHLDDVVTVIERERFVVAARHQLEHDIGQFWPSQTGYLVWSADEEELLAYPRWANESESAISLEEPPSALLCRDDGTWFATPERLYRWSLPEDTDAMVLSGDPGLLVDDGHHGMWAWLQDNAEVVRLRQKASSGPGKRSK